MKEGFKFLFQKLRAGILTAAIVFLMLVMFNMGNEGICYLSGFLTGCLNLLFLSRFLWRITDMRYKRPVLLQRLFFTARYLLILNIAAGILSPDPIEIILFFAGLLSVNLSVIISSCCLGISTGEEG